MVHSISRPFHVKSITQKSTSIDLYTFYNQVAQSTPYNIFFYHIEHTHLGNPVGTNKSGKTINMWADYTKKKKLYVFKMCTNVH